MEINCILRALVVFVAKCMKTLLRLWLLWGHLLPPIVDIISRILNKL